MLCSNWLDRLRSSKGFPFNESTSISPHTETELSSDNNNSNAGSESPTRSTNDPVQTPAAPANDNEQLRNAVSNVLSELFCMGESSTNFPKFKGSRKQTNPRFCASWERNNESGGDNSRVEKSKDLSPVKLLEQGSDNVVGEEEKLQGNLSGFSRTEVMVIDTSCAPWKFEKLLFRKKNVWKVRDKKSKMINVGKKKRKAEVAEEEDVGGEKKQKVVCKFPVNDRLHLKDKLERTSDSVCQASSKERPGNLKLKKASSSVILIKSIPTSKKNGTGIAKNSLKSSR